MDMCDCIFSAYPWFHQTNPKGVWLACTLGTRRVRHPKVSFLSSLLKMCVSFICLGLCKAFDAVPREIFVSKLEMDLMDGPLGVAWMAAFRRVAVNGSVSQVETSDKWRASAVGTGTVAV